jgi:hypothetical protein
MKTKIYLVICALYFSVFSVKPYAQTSSPNNELPKGASEEWFSQASSFIQDMSYDFYPASASEFRVANNTNRIGFVISPDGYTVNNISQSAGQTGWQVKFQLLSVGRKENMLSDASDFVIIKSPKKISYQSAAVSMEYVNGTDGLRQNFILAAKPAGTGTIAVKMKLETKLSFRLSAGRLVFYKESNPENIELIYEDLKVWDAAGKKLNAQMRIDQKAGLLELVVNDQNAVYPITIDPLNKTPEWTTSADGVLPGLLTNLQLQVQTLYGYTVAGLGDINGDSYDDVAVSAPTMADVVTGTGSLTGVGAVFIYLGSPAGLPVAPSKVLQPNTAVTGALFGLSVDAGDITGDGKNDIIIGAPMDRYQTSAQGLLGATNVNVRAGKVYMYRSEDLFSAPNPTPFLQIRLQGTDFFSTGIAGILGSNISVDALFGYSIAVTEDMNGDNKADIIIGSPSYLGIDILSVQSGAAFVYYSNDLSTTSPVQLNTPTPSLLGLPLLPLANTTGLLFGFSVDGAGDYNNDGNPDLVVGAPAGVDLSSLSGIFTGQVLGGSAYVYYGNGAGVNNAIGVRLQANPSGLLSNAANLFGYKIKGVRNASGVRNGNILVGAPAGSVLSNVVGGLQVKAGEVHVFVKKTSSPSSPVVSNQAIASPRSSSILSILAGQTINLSVLYGSSIDNMLDVNCDGIGDIVVGEPLSTAVPLIGADVVGGAAYVYIGKSDGTYEATPLWDLYTNVSPMLGVNATSLIGYSVAGAKYVRGRSQGVRVLVGGPSNSLDFGSGLLNLGNTLGTTFDFAFDNNGLGKSYTFQFSSCNITTLPSELIEFRGTKQNQAVQLNWVTVSEDDVNFYDLQRSTDGSRFETIAIAFAKNGQRNDYGYLDRHPYNGINYYRLKTVDNNGEFKYSNVIAVKFEETITGDVVVAPNPATGSDIKVRFTGLVAGTYKLDLYNAGGQLLQSKTVKVTQHDQAETMKKTESMPAGVYWLNIYDNSRQRVKAIKIFINNN